MGILSRSEIIDQIRTNQLIVDPKKLDDGTPDVEPSSYDLRIGIIIWKEYNESLHKSEIKRLDFDPALSQEKQQMVTMHPGQVMFVITHEQVNLPTNLCGTVYAKNEFSRDGILLFTTGHIDPGIKCPIVIRLVNLRSIPYVLRLGHPIYTIVFNTINPFPAGKLGSHENISIEKTIKRTIASAEAALDNTLYDLSLTSNFIRKDHLGTHLKDLIRRNVGKIATRFFGILVVIATILASIPVSIDMWNKWNVKKDQHVKDSLKATSVNVKIKDTMNVKIVDSTKP